MNNHIRVLAEIIVDQDDKIAELKSANKMLLRDNAEWKEVSDGHYKYYEEESAKASKLNAEKLAYMRIVNQELSVSLEKRHLLANITSQYKERLAGRGKKCK